MTVLLGQSLSSALVLPPLPTNTAGPVPMTPLGLMRFLEDFYALGAPAVNRAALRVEQYRQVVLAHLATAIEAPFYAASFAADQPATAEALLSRREELLAAGHRLDQPAEEGCPERIKVLYDLEGILLDDRHDFQLLPGTADRLNLLLAALSESRHPQLEIWLNEPRGFFPQGTQRLLSALERRGDQVNALPTPSPADPTTDLGRWQHALLGQAPEKGFTLTGDGSLLLLTARRETHLAAYLARLLRDNPAWRPGLLLPLRNHTLDNALIAEGLPSLGVPSTSLARPSLQVLKLITVFLWEPIEVERVMEFVSLVTKPLHWRLGQRIAEYLADTPGLFGPRWGAMLSRFFAEMEEVRGWPKKRLEATRAEYEVLFARRRYPRDQPVPKYDVRDLLNSLRNWALEAYGDSRKKTKDAGEEQDVTGLLVLAAQIQRALELLDAQPETELSYLGVERLIRTVYEPAPTQFQYPEVGALNTVYSAASVLQLPDGPGLEKLVWWDFIEHEPDYFFHRYYPEEISWLADQGISLHGPDEANALATWRQLRPALHTRQQLVLCLPEQVEGSTVEPHPLLGDLEAAFSDGALKNITINIDREAKPDQTLLPLQQPEFAPVPIDPLAGPVPQLELDASEKITERETETPTALEDLLYYPHKWVFRHQLRLQGTPILSIANENRLRGNLSHLFVEQLLNQLKKDGRAYSRAEVHQWIDDNWQRLLRTQGAVLLEYGQEPERVQFVRTMKYATWSLVHYLQENGWRIRGSEEVLTGELVPMGGQQVKGRADLVLERTREGKPEVAVVDLKWRGKTVFKNLLRNAKDVQLCLYAEFIRQQTSGTSPRVHTAYYVLRDALMISRNELAFANIETVAGPDEAGTVQAATLSKVQATYNWRWEQFREGVVEVRCAATLGHLEDKYLNLDHDRLLEMETGDARFDDYRSLIGLVR